MNMYNHTIDMDAARRNKILTQYLNDRQADMIQDVCDFVRIPSVSHDREKVREALDHILNLAKGFGFHTKSCLDGQVGVIETGEGDEVLGILSHVDVVGPGNMDQWKTDPFDPVVKDGKIFGRGTLDDKGPAIASLYAMRAVCELGLPLKKRIQLILGTQEEVEWTDMEAYVKQYPLPDYGFTPDGEFPMCNIEKGGLDLKLVFPLEAGNPAGKLSSGSHDLPDGRYLTRIEAGTASNVVPGACKAQITEYRSGKAEQTVIECRGKAVHSCQPEKGENAIFIMAEQLKSLELNENRLYSLLRMIQERLGDVYGGGLGLCSESEYYNGEFVHRNVFSPTLLKTENGALELSVNARFPYGANVNEIIDCFQEITGEFGGEIVHTGILPAVYVSKEKPFIKAFVDAYDQVSGRKNEFVLAYGGSYAKAMPNIVSWGPIFPGDEDTCHEENEYISISCLMDNAKIFAAAVSSIVLSADSYK